MMVSVSTKRSLRTGTDAFISSRSACASVSILVRTTLLMFRLYEASKLRTSVFPNSDALDLGGINLSKSDVCRGPLVIMLGPLIVSKI